MKTIKSITIILFMLLFLCACSGKEVVDTSSAPTNTATASTTSQTQTESKTESLNSKTESVDKPMTGTITRPARAVMPQNIIVGKTVTVSDTLKKDEYATGITALQTILDSYKYNVSLAVYSVDGNKSLAYNTQAQIFGACTVKAGYTLYACKQMESGNGNLDTKITYEQKHYEPGTGDIQYSPFGTVISMETALSKSMSISDNVGYLMSVDYFGRDGYNTWISELGCDSLVIKPTVWSLKTQANDLIRVWCEMYNYFESGSQYSKFLYNSCTNTLGNYATAALSGVEYSHKQGHNSTGDWLSLSDAGIVWKGDTPYIIAILTDAPGPSSYSAGEFAKIIDIVHNQLF